MSEGQEGGTGQGARGRGSLRGALAPPARRENTEPGRASLQPRAFTLVELLVVIAIIGILAGLVTAGAQAARRRAAVAKAKATIASLQTSIAMYQGDMGEYPSTGNKQLVNALQDELDDVDWFGPYMEFKEDELRDGELLDPWGNPYSYVSINGGSPEHRTRSYDLYSFGQNGTDDGGMKDDIVSW